MPSTWFKIKFIFYTGIGISILIYKALALNPSSQFTEVWWKINNIEYNHVQLSLDIKYPAGRIQIRGARAGLKFERNGNVIFSGPCLPSFAKWKLKNDKLQIYDADSFSNLYNGTYELDFYDGKLILESDSLYMVCHTSCFYNIWRHSKVNFTLCLKGNLTDPFDVYSLTINNKSYCWNSFKYDSLANNVYLNFENIPKGSAILNCDFVKSYPIDKKIELLRDTIVVIHEEDSKPFNIPQHWQNSDLKIKEGDTIILRWRNIGCWNNSGRKYWMVFHDQKFKITTYDFSNDFDSYNLTQTKYSDSTFSETLLKFLSECKKYKEKQKLCWSSNSLYLILNIHHNFYLIDDDCHTLKGYKELEAKLR